MENKSDKHKLAGGRKNALEWTVFSIGLILTVAVLGYLIYSAVTYKEGPPEILLSYTPDPSETSQGRIKVSAKNTGNETAEDVKLEAILIKAGRESETGELTFPFLPKSSEREGWIVFKETLVGGDSILLRVVGYNRP